MRVCQHSVVLATASTNIMLEADPFLGKIGAAFSSVQLSLSVCLCSDSS